MVVSFNLLFANSCEIRYHFTLILETPDICWTEQMKSTVQGTKIHGGLILLHFCDLIPITVTSHECHGVPTKGKLYFRVDSTVIHITGPL